ncbi:hypothetical protein BH11MYX1_BH11MYX1_41810 [soil metagenome]
MLVCAGTAARADVIHGHVHDAANHPIAHAVVAFGSSVFGETDASGAFALEAGTAAAGVVWVRVPDGYVPGPVWATWPGPAELVVHELAHPATQPLRFVVGSDAHLSEAQTSNGASDLAMAIRHATDLSPPPAFFTVLGDVTQGGTEAELDLVEQALPELAGVPWVPVPGNHDWYDGGVTWTKRAGPDNYSFDLAGVHFVVWNMAIDELEILAFLRADLARTKAPIIALTHAPPSATVRAVLAAHRVKYVLTGHAHSNRVVHHEDGIIEFNTEPLLMGGLDFTPAGYRVLTLEGDELHSQHFVTLDRPLVSVLAPRCVQRELLVAATTPTVTARIDGGTPITMRSVGGWDWRAELPVLAPGAHRVDVNGTTAMITACAPLVPPSSGGLTTSLATRWVTPTGGQLLSARPVISNTTIFATVTDLGDGDSGGVIAIDLATGAVRWRTPLPIQARGGVAVVGEIVVVPRIDGIIVGLDATTGIERWTYELRPHTAPEATATFASITADGEDVMIGQQRGFAVLDAADGHPRWRTDPVPEGENSQSLAAVAVGDGIVVGTFNRLFGGVQAWDRATGQPLWQLESDATVGINAAPVIADHTVFIVNAADEVTALDLATGWVQWSAPLDPAGFAWGNATIGTPAYAHGILIVPTLYRDLVALDARTGAELWRHHALPSPIRATHYRGAHEAGYESSPIIVDDRVWVADTSGELAALDLATGAPLFRTAIGAPVLAGLAASGPNLVVASFDGSVRVLSPAPPLAPQLAPVGCATTAPELFGLLIVLGFVVRFRHRGDGTRRRRR